MTSIVEKDRFAAHCGIRLLETGEGTARAQIDILPHHLNGVGVVQGGVLFTLADVALAAASNSADTMALSLVSHITYFKAEQTGTLLAVAYCRSQRRTVANYQVDVTNAAGELIASFEGTVYRKPRL